jgi:uncharacterized protein YqfA (UPF0365 family)
MKIFKVIGNTIAKIGQTVEDVADLVSLTVSDEGLKSTVRNSFKTVNISIAQSAIMAEIEANEEIKQFKLDHNITD